jgi:hypothetical protein
MRGRKRQGGSSPLTHLMLYGTGVRAGLSLVSLTRSLILFHSLDKEPVIDRENSHGERHHPQAQLGSSRFRPPVPPKTFETQD